MAVITAVIMEQWQASCLRSLFQLEVIRAIYWQWEVTKIKMLGYSSDNTYCRPSFNLYSDYYQSRIFSSAIHVFIAEYCDFLTRW